MKTPKPQYVATSRWPEHKVEQFKERFLEALRSGRYKRTDGTLYEGPRPDNDPDDAGHDPYKEGAFCVLGVATDVYHRMVEQEVDPNGTRGVVHRLPSGSALPTYVKKAIGFRNENGQFRDRDPVEDDEDDAARPIDLIDMNDSKATPFKRFANFIEKHWNQIVPPRSSHGR